MTKQLIELGCDAVRIFVSAHIAADQTASYTTGSGNMFAQEALTRNWLTGRDTIYSEAGMRGEDDTPDLGGGSL